MPGLHWRWWFIDQVVKAWGTIIIIDLPNALVTTIDGRSIIVSANLAYRIADIVKMWGKIVNSNETLKNIAIGFLADECANYSWNDLVHLRTSIQGALRDHLQAAVEPWGIAMEQVHLTDLAVTTPYRLYTDGVTNSLTR
jgi:regulator of protease activity HflC (stomatin/prohibitin superfamily)